MIKFNEKTLENIAEVEIEFTSKQIRNLGLRYPRDSKEGYKSWVDMNYVYTFKETKTLGEPAKYILKEWKRRVGI